MKKKTVVLIAVIMSVIILALCLAVCFVYSLFGNENKTYIAILVILPLLPYILLFALLPNLQIKLQGTTKNENSDNDKPNTKN